MSADLASQFNFRGMPNNERGVLQASTDVVLPTKVETGALAFKAWANIDLSNSTGDAWFPDGHAGEPSQIDLHASYSETYRGFDVAFGLVSYALQNPDDFVLAPSGERGETKEFFASASREIAYDLVPSLTLHWDFDEAEGIYLNAALFRQFPINEKFVADANLSVGWSDENQSDWTYGLEESGIADVRLRGGLSYFLDRHTTLRSTLNFSTVVDSDLDDWFDLIGVDSDNLWLTLGATWSY
ncbi:MAG: hypothetical protein AAF368_09760 [Planctomycetota bacterium]